MRQFYAPRRSQTIASALLLAALAGEGENLDNRPISLEKRHARNCPGLSHGTGFGAKFGPRGGRYLLMPRLERPRGMDRFYTPRGLTRATVVARRWLRVMEAKIMLGQSRKVVRAFCTQADKSNYCVT
jgi:hypothetical protein